MSTAPPVAVGDLSEYISLGAAARRLSVSHTWARVLTEGLPAIETPLGRLVLITAVDQLAAKRAARRAEATEPAA